MDISYDNDEIIRRCFKCDEPVLYNLNVAKNANNTTFSLWNKFQIFVYESLEFEGASKSLVPAFQIHDFITSTNYSVCVDYSGNVHTTSLKFKNATQKTFKYGFQPRENNVMACAVFNEEHAICLKFECNTYFVSLHRINTEFTLVKRAIITCKQDMPLQQSRNKYILKVYAISAEHKETMTKVFNIEDMSNRNDAALVIVSFDKLSVYICLFSPKMLEEEVTLIKLYTCPSEISDIDFIELEDLNIIIGLRIGSIINLNLKDLESPKIIHLNTAIHKFSTFKDTILYTDGLSMWKAEQILSKDIKFTQFFVRDVKDFVKYGDQIICTTFTNLMYIFSIDDERSYIKPQSVDEYCCAETLLDDSTYLTKIMEQVKKNEILIKEQTKQRNYITALSVSRRQDIMDNVINLKIIVYECYEDILSENNDVTLTNEFSEYFDKESFYFLIHLTTTAEHRLCDVLSNALGDLRIHISLSSKRKVVKTSTVKVIDKFKEISLLVPLKSKFIDVTDMKVQLKLITNMPGALDAKQTIWAVLYRKIITLSSEHFIKFNLSAKRNVCLRAPKESIEDLILRSSENQYGCLFSFSDISKLTAVVRDWHMYVRLPAQYQDVLKTKDTRNELTSKKENYFLQQFSSEDFLKSKKSLTLYIDKKKVDIEIHNDGFSVPSLKISSIDVKIALDIRNYLSNLIYSLFTDIGPGKEFINHSFYITVENLQKDIKQCLSSSSEEDITPLIEQFEKKVIGLLPI